ncbi:MAG: hypothetical protein K8T89_05740 [Planctomycetes bacterium]|nr:hypothetical protein [Planctomycetota bacterium]
MDVIEKCTNEKKVDAQPFPKELSGTKDPILIPEFVALGNPVVTIDGSFLEDNAPFIPDLHPGFFIIRYSYKVINRQLTSIAAARILHEFKSWSVDWDQASIRNSVVILTERTIEVFHLEAGRVKRDWGGRYRRLRDDGDEGDWINYELAVGPNQSQVLTSQLKANGNRSSIS